MIIPMVCVSFIVLLVFFFFSSRRRHTISLCDWSSDVCSSDLLSWPTWQSKIPTTEELGRLNRSEERRVGKECTSEWSPNDRKKKYDYPKEKGIEDEGSTFVEWSATDSRIGCAVNRWMNAGRRS